MQGVLLAQGYSVGLSDDNFKPEIEAALPGKLVRRTSVITKEQVSFLKNFA